MHFTLHLSAVRLTASWRVKPWVLTKCPTKATNGLTSSWRGRVTLYPSPSITFLLALIFSWYTWGKLQTWASFRTRLRTYRTYISSSPRKGCAFGYLLPARAHGLETTLAPQDLVVGLYFSFSGLVISDTLPIILPLRGLGPPESSPYEHPPVPENLGMPRS